MNGRDLSLDVPVLVQNVIAHEVGHRAEPEGHGLFDDPVVLRPGYPDLDLPGLDWHAVDEGGSGFKV